MHSPPSHSILHGCRALGEILNICSAPGYPGLISFISLSVVSIPLRPSPVFAYSFLSQEGPGPMALRAPLFDSICVRNIDDRMVPADDGGSGSNGGVAEIG